MAVLLLVAPMLGGCNELQPEELARGVETLHSIAAEGSLIADGVARRRTKTTFVRVHGAELSEAAEHEAEKLNDSQRPASLDGYVRRAIEIAQAESDAIDSLRIAPKDTAEAEQQAAVLRKTAGEAAKLAAAVHQR